MKSLKALLFLCFFIFVTVTPVFSEVAKVRVTTPAANIRLEPTTKSTVIARIPLGTVLDVVKKEGNWYFVKLPQIKGSLVVMGYVHQNIVEVIQEAKEVEEKKVVEKEKKIEEVKEARVQDVIKTPKAKEKKLRIGAKMGINSAILNGKGPRWLIGGEPCSKVGFCAGGFIVFNLSDMWAIQPEFLFTQKGTRLALEEDTAEISIDYLQIPILAKFIIPTQAKFKSSLFLGPYFALKLGANARQGSWSRALSEIYSSDLGLVLGGNVEFKYGTGSIIIDLRYDFGLASIFEVYMKNEAISLMVGYIF